MICSFSRAERQMNKNIVYGFQTPNSEILHCVLPNVFTTSTLKSTNLQHFNHSYSLLHFYSLSIIHCVYDVIWGVQLPDPARRQLWETVGNFPLWICRGWINVKSAQQAFTHSVISRINSKSCKYHSNMFEAWHVLLMLWGIRETLLFLQSHCRCDPHASNPH